MITKQKEERISQCSKHGCFPMVWETPSVHNHEKVKVNVYFRAQLITLHTTHYTLHTTHYTGYKRILKFILYDETSLYELIPRY